MKCSLGLLLSAGLLSGCWVSSPPTTPLGHEDLARLDKVTELSVNASQPKLRSNRIVIMGRFESQVSQPIGGLYDHSDYEISPLYRTYFFKHAELELFEHVSDCLRSTGVDFRRDYGTTGAPALVEAPLRQHNPIIMRTKIVKLQHDQVRTSGEPPKDYEMVHMIAEVSVVDLQGQQRYQARKEIVGRIAHQDDANMLRVLGLHLGQKLIEDPLFLQAIEAGAQ